MSKPPKLADGSLPLPPGVEEDRAVFDAPVHDRWTIARERLAEYRRTGETISVDEFMAELDRQIELARANKA